MEAVGAKRTSDEASSRGEQKTPHHKSTTSPSHSSPGPHSSQPTPIGGSYSHPPPPSQPPPPPPSSLTTSTQAANRGWLHGDPPHSSRGYPQERPRDPPPQVPLKTTRLVGSDIHHRAHRRGRSSSPDQESWHTSSDVHLPSNQAERDDSLSQSYSPQMPHRHHGDHLQGSGSDTMLSGTSPSSSFSSSRGRQNGGETSGVEPSKGAGYEMKVNTKVVEVRGQRGGRGGDYTYTRVVNRSEPLTVVGGPPAVVGGPPAVVGGPPAVVGGPPAVVGGPPAVVGVPPAVAGPLSQPKQPQPSLNQSNQPQQALNQSNQHQKALNQPNQPQQALNQPNQHQQALNQPNQPQALNQPNQPQQALNQPKPPQQALNQPNQPQQALNQPNQPQQALNQPNQPQALNQPKPPSQPSPPSCDHSDEDMEATAMSDPPRPPHLQTTAILGSGSPSPKDAMAANHSSSSSSSLQDMAAVSSSAEELSMFHEGEGDVPAPPTIVRPIPGVSIGHAHHHRGVQPLPPPPQADSHYYQQQAVRPTYNSQGAGLSGRGQEGLPPPQTRTALQQQQQPYIVGADPQASYHRPQAMTSHNYPPTQHEERYHYYPSGGPAHHSPLDPFGGPQGMQGPPVGGGGGGGGGGHKTQSRLVRVDPAQMGTKVTKVAIAHDAATKGDMTTLRFLLTSHEIDPVCADEYGSTLIHRASQHGHLAILRMLCSDLPTTYMMMADCNFDTPAMLAIQGGHVECLQCLVQERGVPLEVKDAGGETLIHHAAYHGQHRCLELLLKLLKAVQKTDQPAEILDDSGVTPAHFAAQRGHLECLQLLMNYGYSVTLPDREGQKPSDWADAMGQAICTRYLFMVETSWALSQEVTRLGEQVHILRKQNEQLKEVLKFQEQEHRVALGKLQQEHDLKVTKMKEQYKDITASLLGQTSKPATTSADQKDAARPQQPLHGKKVDAPPQGGRGKPPPGQDGALRRRPARPAPVMDRPPQAQLRDGEAAELALDEVDYRATTPQEVLRRQMTSVEQRMNASRESRKKASDKAPNNKAQNHVAEQQERRPMKVKFAANVTEINSPERHATRQQTAPTSSSPLHTSSTQGTKDSDGTAADGSDSRSHPSEPSHSKKS